MPQNQHIVSNLDEICSYVHQSSRCRRVPGFEDTHRCYRHPKSPAFIFFAEKDLFRKKENQGGWKFHFSVHHADLRRAWSCIAMMLLDPRQGVAGFKVLDIVQHEDDAFDTKQLIIYTFRNAQGQLFRSPDEMFALLLEIEKKWRVAHVRPGVTCTASCKIPGSRYISMRYDLIPSRDDIYISAQDALTLNPACPHNPFNQPNPYDWFSMHPRNHRFFSTPGFGFYREKGAKLIDEPVEHDVISSCHRDDVSRCSTEHGIERGSRCMSPGFNVSFAS